jgi:hypothetical protein
MFRAIILPVLFMGLIGGPMLYSHHLRRNANVNHSQMQQNQLPSQAPWQTAGFRYESANTNNVGSTPAAGTGLRFPNLASPPSSTSFPPIVSENTAQRVPFIQNGQLSNTAPASNAVPVNTTTFPGFSTDQNQAWNQPGMVADVGKMETMVFPGDANGPDLSAGPMSFTPTIDLSSLFRFDITKQSVTSRWDRVSTSPADQGLHGMRVALVTGTNSWDLHGSLTYYFDATHRLQRITYRGWTGDATRLLQTLQQSHQLQAKPTHWAGLYLSNRSGLLMKHPAVIDKSNPVQQLALIMEINNPRGKTPLSNDFQSLLPAAMATQ